MLVSRRIWLQTMVTAVVGASTWLGWEPLYRVLTRVGFGAESTFHDQITRESENGPWGGELRLPKGQWSPGQLIEGEAVLSLPAATLSAMTEDGLVGEKWLCMVSAERLFDSAGNLRLVQGIGCSTFLTPTGLAIEGGPQGVLGPRGGSPYRSYADVLVEVPAKSLVRAGDGSIDVRFPFRFVIPADAPSGVIRLRCDFGLAENRAGHVNHRHSLNGESFARKQRDGWSEMFSAPLPLGKGEMKNRLRVPWVAMSRYSSNGQRGIVAAEDAGYFALSPRHIAPADPIFPLDDVRGRRQEYDVIPDVLAWKSDKQRQLDWAADAGKMDAELHFPSGKVTRFDNIRLAPGRDGGLAAADAKAGRWRAEEYGAHTLVLRGALLDRWGNRYEGGGTYRFHIAERLTIATATFLGQAFQTGQRYGAPIAINPGLAGEVAVELTVIPQSDPARRKTVTYAGKTTESGVFGPANGLKPFLLEEPGEYLAVIRARATDKDGRLWMAALIHAGVIFPPDSPVEARGKKVRVGKEYLARGETQFEGYVEGGLPSPGTDGRYTKADLQKFRHLDHINYPWFSGDALLIAAEGQGANKIEPVLTYVRKGQPEEPKRGTLGIGLSELQAPACPGGWDPFTHQELAKDRGGYWYAGAPRPGFPSRFMVATHGVFAPYWPTSNTNFGGQIGASANGDMPGDIYRLLGGVVVPEGGSAVSYAGYLASAFILPAGTKNNRVVAAGAEDVLGADGKPGRFFLVAVRPGMVYGLGAGFSPFLQIDPVLPATVRYELVAPSGKSFRTEGTGGATGHFIGKETWQLDEPGVWAYRFKAHWNGQPGRMPGLPASGGWLFVTEARELAQAAKLDLGLPAKNPFDPATGFRVQGATTASRVYLSAITPGCVIGQWELPVKNGRFEWGFDPAAIHATVPIYDIQHRGTGRPMLGRVVHLTFFARQDSGKWAWGRIVVRGQTAYTV